MFQPVIMSDGDEQKEMDKKNMEKYGLQADQIAGTQSNS